MRRGKTVGRRSLERYTQSLRGHVVPHIGAIRLQELRPLLIDSLYKSLASSMSPNTLCLLHTVFSACLGAAVRKGLLTANPIARAEKIPSAIEADHGQVLDQEQLASLVASFRGSTLHPIVALAAYTGARRNEILALRWTAMARPRCCYRSRSGTCVSLLASRTVLRLTCH